MSKSLAGITAAILVGGLGTRLRPVVADRPKVLAPINGRPFLAYLLDQLVEAGLKTVTLCTGYRADMIQDEFGDSYKGLRLIYSKEEESLGTAGALRLALPLLESDPVLVLNGDSYCHVNLPDFYHEYAGQPAGASMVLTQVENTARYGAVQVEAGLITHFQEKQDSAGPGWISAGIYLLGQTLLQTIPPGRAVSIEQEMFPAWLERGIGVFYSAGPFIDIGIPEAYTQATTFFAPNTLLKS
jgi:NDP-sugar pyrophosphorylase family protein